MLTYAIVYSPGPAWVPGRSVGDQPLEAHGQYMHQLYQRGILLHGGPFTDDQGGLAVIQVADTAAAQQIVDEDPAVISRVFRAALHPWYRVNWERFGG